jgi:hypothetical protein
VGQFEALPTEERYRCVRKLCGIESMTFVRPLTRSSPLAAQYPAVSPAWCRSK